ncbi:MAG TPA: hypothetical protein VLA66_06590, partial [Thermoanaerobaculia bacterium]|nr:hypothetical protein [Thermoanaerobaculia bacterium]
QGRLPSYRQLSGNRDAFLGQSMAYLAGSAFLEWLERRAGPPDPLPRLWAATTARGRRSFEQAFERVFAERPEALWDRFVAETTAVAIERERALGANAREGELWLDRDGGTGDLMVSPDGRRLVGLVSAPRRPTRLVVWSLGPAEQVPEPPRTPIDPEDPLASPAPPRRREPLATLELAPPRRLLGGRFLPDGETLLVSLLAPDARGDLHAELARWSPAAGLRRLTRSGDLRDADPLPDGEHAIAVRWRHGRSGLVEVDLASGATTDLVPPALDRIHDRPRVSPDGSSLAWLEHRGGRWNVLVARLRGEETIAAPRSLDPASGGEPLDLAWRADGSLLYVAVARGEELDIEALPVLDGALAHRVTRSVGAALGPAPTPDARELYFLGLDADGFDIRRLDLDAATVQERAPGDSETAAAGQPATPGGFAAESLAAPRGYGLGRPEWTALVAGSAGSGPGGVEAGLRVGELLGRWELVALGAAGGDGFASGGALRLCTRPFAANLALHLARFDEGPGPIDAAELRAEVGVEAWSGRLAWRAGLGAARADAAGLDRTTGFVGLELATDRVRGRALLRPRLALAATASRGDSDAVFGRAQLGLDAGLGDWSATLELDHREVDDAAGPHDLLSLGGSPSSLAPPSARPGRIDHAALSPGVATGTRYDAVRLRLARRGPLGLLAERHRLDTGARIDLLGADLRWVLPPTPLLGLPALRLEAGAARVDHEGRAAETRWWLGLVLPVRENGAGAPTHPGFSATRSRR